MNLKEASSVRSVGAGRERVLSHQPYLGLICKSNALSMKRISRSHRYLKGDPDNRLVARVLEAEWNTKLRELEEARALEEPYNQTDQQRVSAEERTGLGEVPARFRQFWQDRENDRAPTQTSRALASSKR